MKQARSGRSLLLLGVLAFALFLVACSHISVERYAEIVEAARGCVDGDTCVLAGAGDCTCPVPVNGDQFGEVEDAAADVDCNGAQVECASHENVRCEAGRCISN